MTKKEVMLYTAIAIGFGAIGAYLAVQRTPVPAPPAPAALAPQPPASPAQALFAQSMNDASGANHALGRWKGKPLVVNFWAPWCAPCVQEMPELDQLATAMRARSCRSSSGELGIMSEILLWNGKSHRVG